CMQALQSPCTV
nr:immunoglobulin light chain junction region [Macaca mulatta]